MLSKYVDLNLSQETIDSQGESVLFKGLTELSEKLKKIEISDSKKLNNILREMDKVVKETTNLKVNIGVDMSPDINAYVYPPRIDKNNPLFDSLRREIYDKKDAKKLIQKHGTLFKGGVDRRKSRVTGAFGDLEIKIFMHRGVLTTKNPKVMAREIAALILHEIGHIFTYFEYLGSYVTTNFVLQHTTRQLLDTRESKRRYEILEETEELLKIELDDKDSLTRLDNETVIQTVILHSKAKEVESELGSKTADLTAFEMLSDQFASRHGAGRDLVTMLNKMYRGHESTMTEDEFFKHQIEAAVGLSVLGVFTLGIVPLLTFLVLDPTKSNYDKPEERIKRVRRDLISQIKESTSKEHKDMLVNQLDSVDKILEKLHDKVDFVEWFWLKVRPGVRKQAKQREFQQELEQMVNNDLFALSHKLEKT